MLNLPEIEPQTQILKLSFSEGVIPLPVCRGISSLEATISTDIAKTCEGREKTAELAMTVCRDKSIGLDPTNPQHRKQALYVIGKMMAGSATDGKAAELKEKILSLHEPEYRAAVSAMTEYTKVAAISQATAIFYGRILCRVDGFSDRYRTQDRWGILTSEEVGGLPVQCLQILKAVSVIHDDYPACIKTLQEQLDLYYQLALLLSGVYIQEHEGARSSISEKPPAETEAEHSVQDPGKK